MTNTKTEKTMNSDFTITLLVDKTPAQAFETIKNVRKWWCGIYGEEITGETDHLNDEFSFRAGGGAHYSKQKLVELIPNKKIAWLVTESSLTFLKNESEWTRTIICFELSKKHNKTQIVFTHFGITPQVECYESISSAWTQYLQVRLVSELSKAMVF